MNLGPYIMIDAIDDSDFWESRSPNTRQTVRDLHKFGCRGVIIPVETRMERVMVSFDRDIIVPREYETLGNGSNGVFNRTCERIIREVAEDFNKQFPDTELGYQRAFPSLSFKRGDELKIMFRWSYRDGAK